MIAGKEITVEVVLIEARKGNRVCPQPAQWQQLYEMLPNRQRKGAGWEPALPLILAAWHETPAPLKMLRLREHIEWADAQRVLDDVYAFLRTLSEDQWHNVGD